MNTIFLCIVCFLILLAIFDLVVGVSNDAVNFINSAIGAKAARFRTIILVAAIGVFAGAATSNGMMDVARHGIMSPSYYSFYDVMCIFLAVMVTDVVLLDIFNSLGMPTSTTVSLVFELLGGSFAIALIMIIGNDSLSFGQMINTEKALSVIFAIFLSVAIAFFFGTVVQWLSRLLFTFKVNQHGVKVVIFGGIAVTSIIWFLLIKGLKGSTLMTPEINDFVKHNAMLILSTSFLGSTLLMAVINLFRVNVLKIVVLLGTFALAMAFAGNDLVNFIGVPLAGLSSYQDYVANGSGDPNTFMMHSLNESANTPLVFLLGAGLIMVLSLMFSKKAQNVVKTSVDLSRQDEGDEMFGSSGVARTLVRSSNRMATSFASWMPTSVGRWIDRRFNTDDAQLESGAAFDLVRAAVNLVLAGLLVALGTSYKLPLSTTYVTFMVAMGSSLADRAWSRESAVFRITGVLSVIGGWFITAGVAFAVCFTVVLIMHFGSYIAMLVMIAISVIMLIRSNKTFAKKAKHENNDAIFTDLIRSKDSNERLDLLWQHIRIHTADRLQFVKDAYTTTTEAFFHEEYRRLRHVEADLDDERKEMKRQRRKEIIGIRKVDPIVAMERNTWFFLANTSVEQMLYCMKRMITPCREHVGNNFSPVPTKYVNSFSALSNEVDKLLGRAIDMLNGNSMEQGENIRIDATTIQKNLSDYRKEVIDDIQTSNANIETMTVFLNIVQESQLVLASLRHMVRGVVKFQE
jgi:phosphate/sulfate permease